MGCTATRPRAYRSHCHSPLGVPIGYARCRVAVNDALPLALERTIPYVHRRVAVRTHCHSPLIVPSRYARCRVAVWDAPPGTFTAEWQCEMYCHSPPGVPDALPLAPGRTNTVRSMPSGSEDAPPASCLAPLASIRRNNCRRSRPVRDSWVRVPLRVALSRRRAQGG